jgi:hypothetical protein
VAELIQEGGKVLCSKIHKLILFGIRTNCLISGRSLSLYQFTRRVIKLTVVIIGGYHSYHLGTTITDRNLIQEEIKRRLNSGNAYYHSVQNLLATRFLIYLGPLSVDYLQSMKSDSKFGFGLVHFLNYVLSVFT